MARNALTPSRSRPSGLTGFNPLMSLNRDINRLFNDFLQPSALPTMADTVATALITPQINVSETDNEIRVTAELPGVDLDDLEVDVADDMLVIRGEKRLERSDEDENYHFVERAYGSFQRTVQLPFAADSEQVRASFENGVLTVTVPKSDQQQRTHRIDVQAGAGTMGGQRAGQQTSQQAGQQASSQGSEQGSQGNGGPKASAQKSEGSSSKRGQGS
ncbi:MAG: heat shock protein Hsp20 [Gammaproteobacteria bacterium]|jgi:HSP20 family protein|nr:heat shock protein Hsp20 [Gammaproteobacteria bacterium]